MTGRLRGRAHRCVVAVAVLGLVVSGAGVAGGTAARAEVVPPPRPAVESLPPPSWPAPPAIDAPAWILVEGATGQVLAARAPDLRRPVASTVKVLTALTVVTRVAPGDVVTVGDEVTSVGGAGVGLRPGDEWTVEHLLDAVLARSGNDAAEALAVHVAGSAPSFVELMAADAAQLGLDGLTLTSPSGLDDGNLLSARDLALIGRAALADPGLRPLLARRMVELPGLGELDSRNLLLHSYPGATGLKTGFTVAAGNSLVGSAVRDRRELVVVVLGAGEDPARFDAAARLLDHGFERFDLDVVEGRLAVAVAGGEVTLTVGATPLTAPTGSSTELAFSIPARAPTAPTAVPVEVDGEQIATLPATFDDAGAPADPAGIGHALADSAYTALRAATGTGVLR